MSQTYNKNKSSSSKQTGRTTDSGLNTQAEYAWLDYEANQYKQPAKKDAMAKEPVRVPLTASRPGEKRF